MDGSLPAHDAITFLSGAGIISGYEDGSFGPGDTLKRGQATKMLVLWQSVPLVDGEYSFPDLDDIYREYVETACAEGWITGFADGRFKAYSTLTRQQMAIIMVRAMGWEEVALQLSGPEVEGVLSVFSDQADISDVARPYVAVAVSEGLFGGDGEGRFNPKTGITRAQFCLVVFRGELSIRAVIEEVRSASEHPDKTRVVFDLSRAPDAVTASVTPDGILTIDYTGGVVAETLSQAIDGSAEVTSAGARQLAYNPRTVRITLDLGRYQTFRVMSLAPSEGKGYRIAVDIYRRVAGPLGDGPPLICIDPGHGGDATGAIGVSGTKEKDINLAISLLLAQDLRKAGLNVIMTREDDRAVDLHERAAFANNAMASLFVSVHNNASGDSDSNGTETFFWGTSTEWSPDGQQLADAIQRNLLEAIGSVDRGAKTHWYNLVVLAETEMTAALAEVGFLTNAAEEAKLVTAAYQQAAAQGITNGILEYLDWSTKVYSTES
ncbi:MAG: hypothetical protein A2133_10505 [Actinobacteria bacterium RBG_16_64_13]|nr:MAG: hypothetical protein A2133_10505 [Actinobacteria bacterium RBG_16_64_13]